jgi:hypothetical protein
MQIATDTFARADQNPIAGNWTSVPSVGFIIQPVQIISARAVEASSSYYAMAFWSANAFPADQYSEMSFATFGAGSYDGPAVRVTAGGNSYHLLYHSGLLFLQKSTAGILAGIPGGASVPATLNLTDILRLEAVGSALTAKINGVVQFSVSDSDFVSGSAGMFFASEAAGLSGQSAYWAGGDFSVGGPASPKSVFSVIT